MDANRAAHLNRLFKVSPELLGLPMLDVSPCAHWFAQYDEKAHGAMHVKMHACVKSPFKRLLMHCEHPREVLFTTGRRVTQSNDWTDVFVVEEFDYPVMALPSETGPIENASSYLVIAIGQATHHGAFIMGHAQVAMDAMGRPVCWDNKVPVHPSRDMVETWLDVNRDPVALNANGESLPRDLSGLATWLVGLLHPALFALSLSNAKNVTMTDDQLPRQVRRAREMQHFAGLTIKTLEIGPMQRAAAMSASTRTDGEILTALHLCRGSFATYGEDRRLFGKYSGTFWRPAHLRGNPDGGVVAKDYAIKEGSAVIK